MKGQLSIPGEHEQLEMTIPKMVTAEPIRREIVTWVAEWNRDHGHTTARGRTHGGLSALAQRSGIGVRQLHDIVGSRRQRQRLKYKTAERLLIALNRIEVLFELDEYVSPRKTWHDCAGCGCELDYITLGCKSCYDRHRRRALRAAGGDHDPNPSEGRRVTMTLGSRGSQPRPRITSEAA